MCAARTRLSVDGTRFLINGELTYRGTRAEGLLFNVRTVNATFDDTLGKVDWWDDDGSRAENDHAGYGKWTSPASAVANTQRFIEGLPAYREHGVRAVNLNFQGGHPIQQKTWIEEGRGSAGRRPNGHRDFYHNSGFNADGSIDADYAKRIASVIEACDGLGMAVILQLFYFGQDTALASEDAIRAAVDNTVDFVCGNGYANVIVEIANEVMQGHYHFDVLKPGRVAELIARARARARETHGGDLMVSTSEAALTSARQWTDEQKDAVYGACDLVIIHGGDNIETGKVGDASDLVAKVEFFRSRPWYRQAPRPVITNESSGQQAFEALVRRGVSFGLHSGAVFQTVWPPRWGVWDNETSWFFKRVKSLTEEAGPQRQ